ncbi:MULTISPECIES: hypothetical protein [Mesoplasma]|uniref:Uncharacterized protein n=1 Tax=Mesoplasma florum TaxID=2151 RepID=A0A2R3P6S1_MESFO|nr:MULTISPECIES: hypothetical protein [Mesoplasma]AVN64079.1 hypothetical protein CG003_00080 [Mesoplasma florum]
MKKLLITLSSALVVSTAGMSVVSCGVKPEKQVVLLLPGESIGAGSTYIQDGYREIVNEFNQLHQDDENFVPIKVQWKPSGTIQSAILSGDNLPDLYVSYPDQASLYKSTKLSDRTRDMKESMTGETQGAVTEESQKAWDDFEKDLISNSFLQEGQYNGEQLILPFGKSFDVSVINVNLFIDYLRIYDKANADIIQTNFEQYNKDKRSALTNSTGALTKISFFDKEKSRQILGISNSTEQINLSDELNPTNWVAELAGKTETELVKGIREIFKDIDKILKIAEDYNKLAQAKQELPIDVTSVSGAKGNNSKDKNFSFAVDSIANKLFMDYAATSGNEIVDTNDQNNDFFYSVQYTGQAAKLVLNDEWIGSENTLAYLDGMRDLALTNGNDKLNTYTEQWNGTFATSVSEPKKIYTSTYFANGTTFMAAGSSAGSYNFTKKIKDKNNADLAVVTNADLLTAPSASGKGTGNAFMSQGPGIAGFKSNGSNTAEKEKTVTMFLQYMVQPQISARFGLRTNYMPTSKKGMAVYQNYVNGKFDNSKAVQNKDGYYDNEAADWIKNQDIINATKGILGIDTEPTPEQIKTVFKPLTVTGTGKDGKPYVSADSRASTNSINAGFIDDYLSQMIENDNSVSLDEEKDLSEKTLLVSSKPNPLGQEIRSSIDKATVGRETITDLRASHKFSELVSYNGKRGQYYNIGYWMNKNSGTDMFKQIDISMKVKKGSK